MDGVAGLEPANGRIKIYCLTNLAIPQQNKCKIESNENLAEAQEKTSPDRIQGNLGLEIKDFALWVCEQKRKIWPSRASLIC